MGMLRKIQRQSILSENSSENKDKSDYFTVVNVRDDVVTKMYYGQN
jgi:hypothetical protein